MAELVPSFGSKKVVLIAIVLLGFFLRVIFVNSSPPSLYGDELTIALDSYSLLRTGHDQLGNFLPLTFPMGAGRPAGYVYGSIPFIAIFGPTALGVRMLSILSGMGIIVLLYFLGEQLFSQRLGLLASFIGAVSPWEISLSRGGFEAHFALFLALLGLYLFLKARNKPLLFVFSLACFGLTLHSYPTYKLTLLLFLPLLFWFSGIRKNFSPTGKKYFIFGLILFLLLGFTALTQTFIGGSETRFSGINIFSQQKIKSDIEQKIDYERQITDLPGIIAKNFHNTPVEYGKVLLENYLQNFSMDFLIIHGDRNPRQNMATMGEIYLADAFLIIIGILSFWSKSRKSLLFLFLWIVLSPISTAIVDLPHALRSALMLPPLLLLSALGLDRVISQRKRIGFYLISALFLIQFIFFFQKLYFLAPKEYSNFWAYSGKLASQVALENKDKYNFVILSDKIDSVEFAYPVYAKIDPQIVIEQNSGREKLGGHDFKRFGNVFIGTLQGEDVFKLASNLNGSMLYVTVASDIRDFKDKDYQTLKGLDGKDSILMFKK